MLLASANGWHNDGFKPEFKIHLITHITGGGIKSKFGEDILFPRGLSATLVDLWSPPEIMRRCADWRGIVAEECYTTWNGGQGALVVVDSKDADRFINYASEFGVEAKDCGLITENATPCIVVVSQFSGETFEFI